MPSRNNINTPKMTLRSSGKPARKPVQLIEGKPVTLNGATKLTTKVISKKRAKKNARNAKYRESYVKSLESDAMMVDDDSQSNTQRKKLERLHTLSLISQQDLPPQRVEYASPNGGTTLGQPPN